MLEPERKLFDPNFTLIKNGKKQTRHDTFTYIYSGYDVGEWRGREGGVGWGGEGGRRVGEGGREGGKEGVEEGGECVGGREEGGEGREGGEGGREGGREGRGGEGRGGEGS